MILVQILLNASMNGFGERYSIYGKSGAIKYSTHFRTQNSELRILFNITMKIYKYNQ